jgi:hypothetical protein
MNGPIGRLAGVGETNHGLCERSGTSCPGGIESLNSDWEGLRQSGVELAVAGATACVRWRHLMREASSKKMRSREGGILS